MVVIKNKKGKVLWKCNWRTSLKDVYLNGLDLHGADLRNRDLKGAHFGGADLTGADLRGCKNFLDAYFGSANLKNAKLPKWGQIPQNKDLVVYKKVYFRNHQFAASERTAIAKLLIKKNWKRTGSIEGNKCRAEKALVLEIKSCNNGTMLDSAYSCHDNSFVYTVGKTVKPTNGYDSNFAAECRPGIHFFMKRKDAEKY